MVPGPRLTVRQALLHPRRPRRSSDTAGVRTRRPRPASAVRSSFAGFRFPADVIVLAVRWYLHFGLSYRDLEELLTGHCCIEPECAGEAQQSGGSPLWKAAKKGSNHSTVPMICRL